MKVPVQTWRFASASGYRADWDAIHSGESRIVSVAAQGKLRMVWTSKDSKFWRVAVLVLLVVAMLGPWGFDRIYVPSKYACSSPFVRLEGDFCGVPMRGTTVLYLLAGGFIGISVELVTGATALSDRTGEFLFCALLPPLLVLPLISTFLLILRRDRRRRQVFSIVAWGLAAGAGLLAGVLIGLSYGLKYTRFLWGIWLYIGLAPIALVLEVSILAAGRRLGLDG